MRLVYRDKGCVVCHAEGTASIYQYRDDSRFFEGSHIYPFAMQSTVCSLEPLIVDLVEHNPSKVGSAWISESYGGPIYRNERSECYPQQARSVQN
jgi:hypothetical protein